MKRLSLEELRAQKSEDVKENLESINGGKVDWCHFWASVKAAFTDRSYEDAYMDYNDQRGY